MPKAEQDKILEERKKKADARRDEELRAKAKKQASKGFIARKLEARRIAKERKALKRELDIAEGRRRPSGGVFGKIKQLFGFNKSGKQKVAAAKKALAKAEADLTDKKN